MQLASGSKNASVARIVEVVSPGHEWGESWVTTKIRYIEIRVLQIPLHVMSLKVAGATNLDFTCFFSASRLKFVVCGLCVATEYVI